MNFPQIENTFLLFGLLFIFLALIILFFNSMSSLKREGIAKITLIKEKIEHEKKHAGEMANQINCLSYREKSIQNDLMKIRVELFNIDFSIKEICKFI